MRIAVVCGGPSAEAEVSRVSGQCVADGLARRGHDIALMELSPRLAEDFAKFAPDTVAPMLHGVPGEDGSVQAFLDVLGLSYVGSGHAACATAIHKSLTKLVARRSNLPVAEDFSVRRGDDLAAISKESIARFGASIVVKPDTQGSALGVRLLHEMTPARLHAELEDTIDAHEQLLIEPFVRGAELTVGVLDEHGVGPRAFPVIEIRTPENAWYDYEHRYAAGLSTHLVPAPIPEADAARMQAAAVTLHEALGCKDLSRTDFIRAASGEMVLLEINNLPGMTPTSLYPDGARAIGIDFDELVERLAISAMARGPSIHWP